MIKTLKSKTERLPTDLKWMFWFSASLFFAGAAAMLFSREQLYEAIIPYTGSAAGLVCFVLVSILITVPKKQIETSKSNPADFVGIRYKIILLLGIYMSFGIYDWLETQPEWYTHNNPYLRYEPLRPVYAIFLPLLWILIVVRPIINNFFRKRLSF
jgi:hypothetical protein